MAKVKVEWTKSGVSIMDCASYLGFDLSCFDGQKNEEIKSQIKSHTISEVLKELDEDWGDEYDYPLKDVEYGVYIIALSSPLAVAYYDDESSDNETIEDASPILYIGRGNIRSRLHAHLHNVLFDLSRSLNGIDLEIYMTEKEDGRSPDMYKDLEAALLDRFSHKFGEKPILNKIAGRQGAIEHEFDKSCFTPLKRKPKKSIYWTIRPEEGAPWFKQIADD